MKPRGQRVASAATFYTGSQEFYENNLHLVGGQNVLYLVRQIPDGFLIVHICGQLACIVQSAGQTTIVIMERRGLV